jgi:hypothetical protein
MNAARNAGECKLLVKMGWSGDGQGIDAGGEQRLDILEAIAAERAGDEVALLALGVGYAHELDPGKISENAGVVAAHDADADHTYA